MVVEAWSLHLYCEICGQFQEIGEDSRRRATLLAKYYGWAISKDRMRAYCPKHNRWKRKPKERKD